MKLFTVEVDDYIKYNTDIHNRMKPAEYIKDTIEVDKFMPVSLMKAWFNKIYDNEDSFFTLGSDLNILVFEKDKYMEATAVHSGTLNTHKIRFTVKKINLGCDIPESDTEALINL